MLALIVCFVRKTKIHKTKDIKHKLQTYCYKKERKKEEKNRPCIIRWGETKKKLKKNIFSHKILSCL